MVQLILTRYLYSVDEVFHSLLLSLIKKKSFQKSLFWLSELYYSKFYLLLWKFVWQTYYDFYAVTNPKFEKYISKCNKNWEKKNNIEEFVNVINILYYATSITNTVFTLRTKKCLAPNKIYTKKRKWMKDFKNLSKKEYLFIRSLHDKKIKDINFYFHQIQKDFKRCDTIIKKYRDLKQEKTKLFKYDNKYYGDKQHIILSSICCLINTDDKVNKRLIKKKINSEDIEFVRKSDIIVEPIRKTLPLKREFSIDVESGFLNNDRPKKYQENFWYHWEYYTQNCPLWDERFKKYKCGFDDAKKEPVFLNDDDLEDFYEKFGYEPDEQTKNCQMKSLLKLESDTIIDILKDFTKKKYLKR